MNGEVSRNIIYLSPAMKSNSRSYRQSLVNACITSSMIDVSYDELKRYHLQYLYIHGMNEIIKNLLF